MKKIMDADCDHDARNSISTCLRIAREYDFFERRSSGPWRITPLPTPKEVVFPQIFLSDDQKLRRKSINDDDSVELIRLFGVNITIDHHNDRDATTVSEKMTIENLCSTKRKSGSSSSRGKCIHDSVELITGKNPTKIRLFGVDIFIDSHNSRESIDITTVGEIENPNSRKRKSRIPNFIVGEASAPLPPLRILEEHRVLLFEKKLESSDVCRGQNRLLITKSDSKQLVAILTEEEKGKVLMNKTDFLRVLTRGRDGVEYMLHLKLWAGSGSIVLKHQWSKLVAANGLKKGDSVQGWGYRVRDEFRLELVVN